MTRIVAGLLMITSCLWAQKIVPIPTASTQQISAMHQAWQYNGTNQVQEETVKLRFDFQDKEQTLEEQLNEPPKIRLFSFLGPIVKFRFFLANSGPNRITAWIVAIRLPRTRKKN